MANCQQYLTQDSNFFFPPLPKTVAEIQKTFSTIPAGIVSCSLCYLILLLPHLSLSIRCSLLSLSAFQRCSTTMSGRSASLIAKQCCSKETELTVRCHDSTFKEVTVLDATGHILYTVSSKGYASMSWRRTVTDALGVAVFKLRHIGNSLRNEWTIETLSGIRLASFRRPSKSGRMRLALDGIIHRNAVSTGRDEVVVEVRPEHGNDHVALVEIEGCRAARVENKENNDVLDREGKGLDRTVWRVQVMEGQDMSLVRQRLHYR